MGGQGIFALVVAGRSHQLRHLSYSYPGPGGRLGRFGLGLRLGGRGGPGGFFFGFVRLRLTVI